MGLIRKTLSISTLGLVSWKGKKELLAEAEAELEQTRAGLAATRAELEEAAKRGQSLEEHLDSTRSKLTKAELAALRESRRAQRKRGGNRWNLPFRRRPTILERAKDLAGPLVESTREAGSRFAEDAEPVVEDVRAQSRKAGRKARKRAEEQADELRGRAGKRASQLRTRAERRADEVRYRTTGSSKRLGTRFRVAGRRAASTARDRADEVRDAASETSSAARDAVAKRTKR